MPYLTTICSSPTKRLSSPFITSKEVAYASVCSRHVSGPPGQPTDRKPRPAVLMCDCSDPVELPEARKAWQRGVDLAQEIRLGCPVKVSGRSYESLGKCFICGAHKPTGLRASPGRRDTKPGLPLSVTARSVKRWQSLITKRTHKVTELPPTSPSHQPVETATLSGQDYSMWTVAARAYGQNRAQIRPEHTAQRWLNSLISRLPGARHDHTYHHQPRAFRIGKSGHEAIALQVTERAPRPALHRLHAPDRRTSKQGTGRSGSGIGTSSRQGGPFLFLEPDYLAHLARSCQSRSTVLDPFRPENHGLITPSGTRPP